MNMPAKFFINNRKKLSHMLEDELFVIPAYSKMQRSYDEAHDFLQESNFWYLTGIEEPDWLLVYDGKKQKSILVRPSVEEHLISFYGQLSLQTARTISGVDEIVYDKDIKDILQQLSRRYKKVYTLLPSKNIHRFGFVANPAQQKTKTLLKKYFTQVEDCRPMLSGQRAIKQPEEIIRMKHAISVTKQAFDYVSQHLNNYTYEYEIEADMSYIFRNHGGAEHAYKPIVANAHNACTLHYDENAAKLIQHTPVLIDVGARTGGYNADITRTLHFGTPSKRYAEMYNALLTTQKAIIKELRPGLLLHDLQSSVDDKMFTMLQQLGLADTNKKATLHQYFPHAIGHGLGIDVHEPLGYSELKEGMVLTIEPGVYIAQEKIGIRIEDDILITADGHKNLSQNIQKDLVY